MSRRGESAAQFEIRGETLRGIMETFSSITFAIFAASPLTGLKNPVLLFK